MAGRGRSPIALGDDDAGGTLFDVTGDTVGRGGLVVLGRLRVDGQKDVGGQRSSGISALPLPHFLESLLLELPGLLLHRQLGFETRASHEVRIQTAVKSGIQAGVFALLEFGLEKLQLPLHGIHDHLTSQGVVHFSSVQP